MGEKIKKYEAELAQKETELKEAAIDHQSFKNIALEIQNSRAKMEGKVCELSMAMTQVDELKGHVARLEDANKALSANVVHVTDELDKVNAHVAKLHRGANMIKDKATQSRRRTSMAKYKSVIAKYWDHLTAREKWTRVQCKLDQYGAASEVL